MGRMIDADALIDNICRYASPEMAWDRIDIVHKINEMPTIEERKGKWIRTRTIKHDGELYCDQCEQEHPEQKKIWNYCPNCGAKMEGVENG